MARLPKIAQKIFGSTAGAGQIGKFGSFAAGSPATTTDAAQVQSLSNWGAGWGGAVVSGGAPAREDMNAVPFLLTQQIAYQQQLGIGEWDATTTYYLGCFAQDGYGNVYASMQDNNTNHAVTDTAWWQKVIGNVGIPGYLSGAFGSIGDESIGASTTGVLLANYAMMHNNLTNMLSMTVPAGYWILDATVTGLIAGLPGSDYLQSLQLGINNVAAMPNTTGCYTLDYFASGVYVNGRGFTRRISSDTILVPKGTTSVYSLLASTFFSGAAPGTSSFTNTATRLTRRRVG